ncbi:hypothetical protein [Nitrosospira sp. Is2]|uniref:hypothetical protein n=1 Tax=Nitrosospira sp. Is2 TaxID=3080532 RepID=UPI00295489C4|nr:hypothetical protein [Nitrosospira sp. Is2]WON73218.1 hypothetical protein R5L00_12090 [Nitrosospira sp. Is2]
MALTNPKFGVGNFGYKDGWRVNEHPRFVEDVTGDGKADIVGFAHDGVWVSQSNGGGAFQAAKFGVGSFGYKDGWRVDEHSRLVEDVTGDRKADIVGFAHDGVWVSESNGDGTFQAAKLGVGNFGYKDGWRFDEHTRFVEDVTGDHMPDIVGFAHDEVGVSEWFV